MSAIALDLLQHLRESGVADDRARSIAELFDRRVTEGLRESARRVEEALREAKSHADRNRAETEQKARAEFVSREEYHARDKTLATRDDLLRVEKRMENGFAEIRKDIRLLYHILIGGLIALVGMFLGLLGGVAALIAKLYFGV